MGMIVLRKVLEAEKLIEKRADKNIYYNNRKTTGKRE